MALFFTIVTFRRTKRLDQITLSNNIFSELRNLDLELAKIPSGSQFNDTRSQWYSRIFNSVNWLGNISVANAYLADISSNENRSKNFGKMAISSNLGFIVGPALAAILGSTIFGEILPVMAALILSLVTLIVISLSLKEFKSSSGVVLVPEKGTIRKVFAQECKECYNVEDPKRLRLKDVFKLKQISFLLMLYFLIFLGFNIFYATFAIQAVNGLKWSVTQLGVFYAALSGMLVLVEGPVLRKALKKFSEEILIVISSIILGANFIF